MLRKVARQQLLSKQCEAGYRPAAIRPIENEHQIVARASRTDRPTRWNDQRRRLLFGCQPAPWGPTRRQRRGTDDGPYTNRPRSAPFSVNESDQDADPERIRSRRVNRRRRADGMDAFFDFPILCDRCPLIHKH
jgi:hypothetical protein